MVHRAPDSRLLSNLINHEKELAKHLAALFPLSHAALASLSAYAAASPSSQHTIAAVVDILASADNALQRYAHALDTWREQLVALKDLEDDLTAVLRDRDIFVTRLIKASKSTRDAHRSSRLIGPLSNLGSASLSSLPSTNSTAFSSAASSPASTNPKLAQAQAELQACEAHLVSKERELDDRRLTLARDGLGARCRALIDCGWVWGEMGKQGLRALQALSANGSSGHVAPKQSLTIPPRLGTHTSPTTYASDNSSLTPSQSASQTAARSVETSLEGPTSKEHEHVQSKMELATISKPQSTRTNEDGDLTITLPPAHAISELALPTSVRAQPRPLENGDATAVANAGTNSPTHPQSQPAAVPRRRPTKPSRRPPSQHITEVSDEESDDPPSASNSNSHGGPRVPNTPFPTARTPETQDTSSDDEPTGPLQVVENDPFEVIRRSMLGPMAVSASPLLAATAPTARASAPDVRTSIIDDSSPSKVMFPGPASLSGHGHGGAIGIGPPPGTISSPAKRQRRTSMAFFGSLRGLFRKPRERTRLGVDWDESSLPASPPQRAKTSGWVTRTDARIKARGGEDSDGEVMSKGARTTANVPHVVNMGRSASRARLRKGRPGAAVRENGPSRTPHGVDGWVTDTQAGIGSGAGIDAGGTGASTARSRTQWGTMRRKKTSVADLRGGDQGHTDGEVDERHRSLVHSSSKGTGKAFDPSASRPIVEVQVQRQRAAPAEAIPIAVRNDKVVDSEVGPGTQHRRAMTTAATSSRKQSFDAALPHRRSASLSLVDGQMSIVSTSTSSQATTQSMSWRKPPPQVEPPSQPTPPPRVPSSSPLLFQSQSQLQSQAQPSSWTYEPQSKQNARRNLGNGHVKHVHNQSLMSIVADVTQQNQDGDRAWVMDRARSLDIPRAPGPLLRERDREVGAMERGLGTGVSVNAQGHAGTESSPGDGGQVSQGQGQGQRAVKLPLKSALRNASRTPSPSPGPSSAIVPTREVKKDGVEDRGRSTVLPVWRDSASISSYETGKESLDGEELERVTLPSPSPSPPRSPPLHSPPPPPTVHSQSRSLTMRSQSLDLSARSQTSSPLPPTPSFTFPPPPVDPPPVRVAATASNPILVVNANANEPPSSSVSTETSPAQRRKSVRMSLQPTFSPTPPALGDEDGEYAPWNESHGEERGGKVREGSGGKTGKGQGDVWADSSDEDETYSRARRLLSLVGRGKA